MKKQIRRISPHQNAKVFAILMAISSLAFVVPMFIALYSVTPQVDQHGNQVVFQKYLFAAFPLIYLIFGYLSTLIGCSIYNFMFRFIGGFEIEMNDQVPQVGADSKDQIESGASAFIIK